MYKRERNGQYFHVTFDHAKNKWHIKTVGDSEIRIFNTKEEAIKEAEKLSNFSLMGHVVIHNEKGKFESLC